MRKALRLFVAFYLSVALLVAYALSFIVVPRILQAVTGVDVMECRARANISVGALLSYSLFAVCALCTIIETLLHGSQSKPEIEAKPPSCGGS